MERIVEKFLYQSRWLLAPIYLGLAVAILALGIKFFHEAFHLMTHIFEFSEAKVVLAVLSLIDLAMVGGLIVMVMLSGYENFVSHIDEVNESDDKLSWLGKMDSTSLKGKIAASIVAISSIHLLKKFMDLSAIDTEHLKWYVIMHLTFVASAFAMGYLDTRSKVKS